MTEIVNVSKDLIDKFFPNEPNIDKTKLQVTNEGIYSMSGVKGSCFMAEIIMNHMKTKNLVITDGTANNGSESIIYGILFKKVNSIELNPVNFKVLQNNINIYGLTNINLINGNSLKEIENLNQDVIVLDAPWGGPDYKKYDSVKLFMSNLEISDIVIKFWKKAKLFVLKVPKNYDFNFFSKKVPYDFKIYNYKYENHTKFKIIVLENF